MLKVRCFAGIALAALLVTALPAAAQSRVEPFRIDVPAPVIRDLEERLARTRWPDQLPSTGWSYGADTAYLRELGRRADELVGGRWEPVAQRWLELAPDARGRRVRVRDDAAAGWTGTTDGIADDGALVVRSDSGWTKLVRLAGSVEPLAE